MVIFKFIKIQVWLKKALAEKKIHFRRSCLASSDIFGTGLRATHVVLVGNLMPVGDPCIRVCRGLSKCLPRLVKPADGDMERQAGGQKTKLTGRHKDRSHWQLCREMTDFPTLWRSCWLAVKFPPPGSPPMAQMCPCRGVRFTFISNFYSTDQNTVEQIPKQVRFHR